MGFDHRLDCLRIAITEDWPDLDAREENGALVVRVREPAPRWRRSER